MKKILFPWVASFVVMFSLSGLFNNFLIRGFLEDNISTQFLRSPPEMIYIITGYLLLALLMTLLFPRIISATNTSLKSGLLFGAFISVLWLLPVSLVLHGVYNFPGIALLIDSSWAVLEQGLGGMTISICLGFLNQRNK